MTGSGPSSTLGVPPAAWLFLAACAGVGLAQQAFWPPIAWSCAALATALWGTLHRHWGLPQLEWVIFVACLCTAGQLAAEEAARHARWFEAFPEGRAKLTGRMVGTNDDRRWLFESVGRRGERVRLWVIPSRNHPDIEERFVHFKLGGTAQLEGDIVHVRPAGNPGEFDARGYSLRQGVMGTLYVDAVELPQGAEVAVSSVAGWTSGVERARSAVKSRIVGHASETAGPILLGMLIGDRSRISDDTALAVQRSGIGHLLAVSGLHVGLVAGTVWLLAGLLRVGGWPRYIFTLVVIVAYVVITGGRPSALRAGTMSGLGLLALQLGRRTDPLHFWGLAGLALLLIQPGLLGDLGFQLSFAASGTILWWLRPVRYLAGRANKYDRLRGAAHVTWAAQAGTTALVAYHFHEFSVAGMLVNVVAVPLAGPVVALGVLGAALGFVWSPLGGLLIGVAGFLVDAALPVIAWVGQLRFAAVEVPAPSAWVLVTWYATIVAFPLLRAGGRARRIGLRLCLGALLCLLPPVWGPAIDMWRGRVEIVFIDVGQGDAILIRTPRGRSALIDGGGVPQDPGAEGYFDIGARRLLPFLQHIGVRELDLVVNTHAHNDHLQGLLAILEHRTVRHVTDPGDEVATVTYEAYRTLIETQDLAYRPAQSGDRFELEPGVWLHIIHPPKTWEGRGGLNDRSLVIRLETRHGSVLLTGDLERSGQQELLWGDEKVDLAAAVIKVPHHGSRRDLELRFIDAVAPQVAVITVGRNHFGHPSPVVEQAYIDRGARLFRTDRHGAVFVRLTEHGIRVRTHRRDAGTT